MTHRKKKSGRLMLRMDPDIHANVARTAKLLGTDINGLLNLIVREGLPFFSLKAEFLAARKNLSLLKQWKSLNPNSGIMDFFKHYTKALTGEYVLFENCEAYLLVGYVEDNEPGKFVKVSR